MERRKQIKLYSRSLLSVMQAFISFGAFLLVADRGRRVGHRRDVKVLQRVMTCGRHDVVAMCTRN